MNVICRLLAGAALIGAAVQLRAGMIDGMAAVVHDAVVTRLDVADETRKAEEELSRDYGNQPAVYETKLREAEQDNLETLMQRQLILHEFKTAGYNLPERYIEDYVEAEVRSHGDRMTFIRTLKATGTTFEHFRQGVRDRLIERLMRDKNVSSEIIISPHKIEAYYQEHHESYKLPDRVKLRLIVLNKTSDPEAPRAVELAREILNQINGGASFVEMATVYSDDRLRQQGGDRGWIRRGELRPEIDQAAFLLKPGQHSGVIETPEACYMAEVDGVEAAHYSPLNEVRGQIEKDLQDHERARLQKNWIDKLKKKTFWRWY
jgi:parvulin-like peptidyl-prolyl isomerase